MTITADTIARPYRLLRFALTFDGVVTAASGVALTAFAGPLADPLGLPAAALLSAGLFFVVYGAAVLYLGTRQAISRRGASAVVVVNLLSALDSVLVAVLGGVTTLGAVVLVALAVAVAGLAGLQAVGLRRG